MKSAFISYRFKCRALQDSSAGPELEASLTQLVTRLWASYLSATAEAAPVSLSAEDLITQSKEGKDAFEVLFSLSANKAEKELVFSQAMSETVNHFARCSHAIRMLDIASGGVEGITEAESRNPSVYVLIHFRSDIETYDLKWYPQDFDIERIERLKRQLSSVRHGQWGEGLYDASFAHFLDSLIEVREPLQNLRELVLSCHESSVREQNEVRTGETATDEYLKAKRLLLEGRNAEARSMVQEASRRYRTSKRLRQLARALAEPAVTEMRPQNNADSMANARWLRKEASAYRGKWVALKEGKLMGAAGTAKELREQLGDLKRYLVTRIY